MSGKITNTPGINKFFSIFWPHLKFWLSRVSLGIVLELNIWLVTKYHLTRYHNWYQGWLPQWALQVSASHNQITCCLLPSSTHARELQDADYSTVISASGNLVHLNPWIPSYFEYSFFTSPFEIFHAFHHVPLNYMICGYYSEMTLHITNLPTTGVDWSFCGSWGSHSFRDF